MNQDHQAGFAADDQDILSQLVPEDDVFVEEAVTSLPDAEQPATPAPETAPAAAKTETTEPAAEVAPEEPKGNPKAALRASRNAEQRLRSEVVRLKEENAQLKLTSKTPESDTSYTEAELKQMEEDFPVQAKIARRQIEIEKQLAVATSAAKPAPVVEFEPLSYDPAVQDVIDDVPQLQAWQYDPAEQAKFERAIGYDSALAKDPDWQDRPIVERFHEAVRRTNAAFKVAATPSPAPGNTRKSPEEVIAALKPQGPRGISDFRGGSPPNAPTANYSQMSDEAIMASLKPE